MDQFEELEFDAEIHPPSPESVSTTTTEYIYNSLNQEWAKHLQPTQAIAEIVH